jgi:proline iminopeptidase
MARTTLWILGILLASASCDRQRIPSSESVAQAGAGSTPMERMLAVPGGRIWYRQSGGGAGIPAILLHGGPGFSSFYLKPLESLGGDRSVIRYDQLGSGKSDPVTDTTLFTVEHFVAELDSLRSALGYERVHIIGHSWGTMLAAAYHRAHPERVASLVFASPCLSTREWEASTRALIATLSDSSRRAIARREADGNFAAADYRAAMREFYALYVQRRAPQADADSSDRTFNQRVYTYMWGPSEFTALGTLKTFDATPQLRTLSIPVLYTVGEFDEAGPATVKRFSDMTPGSQYALIPGAAHMTTWDNPEETNRVIRAFLRRADSAATRR